MISFLLDLLLSLLEVFITLQKLAAILLAVVLFFQDTLFKALVIDEVPAGKSSKEKHTGGSALHATDISWIEVHFFHGVNFFTDISGNVRVGRCDKVNEFAGVFVNFPNLLQDVLIEGLFSFGIDIIFKLEFVFSPFFCASPAPVWVSLDERMLDVLLGSVAAFTKLIRSAKDAFVW